MGTSLTHRLFIPWFPGELASLTQLLEKKEAEENWSLIYHINYKRSSKISNEEDFYSTLLAFSPFLPDFNLYL